MPPTPGWYHSLASYCRRRFGRPLRKLPLTLPLTCPNRDGTKGTGGCLYCGPTGSGRADTRPVAEQIASALAGHPPTTLFWAYFQAWTNTYAAADDLKPAWDTVRTHPSIRALSVGTRPDCLDDSHLDLLASYTPEREVWIELGLQSAHDRTLERIGRGHSVADFLRAVERTARYPLKLCVHLILGLPDETPDDMLATARLVASLPVHGVKFHMLYVERGSRLADLHTAHPLPLLPLEDYADILAHCLELLPSRIVIHRLVSDCPADRLLAPDWILHKPAVLRTVQDRLLRLATWQGRLADLPSASQAP